MTKRLTVGAYLQTFDGADPNVCTSDRDESVTPLQALYFVNDEFVHEQAAAFAKRLVAMQVSDDERVREAFTAVLGRYPSLDESQVMIAHLDAVEDRLGDEENAALQAWSSVVRSLFRLNEFLYID